MAFWGGCILLCFFFFWARLSRALLASHGLRLSTHIDLGYLWGYVSRIQNVTNNALSAIEAAEREVNTLVVHV